MRIYLEIFTPHLVRHLVLKGVCFKENADLNEENHSSQIEEHVTSNLVFGFPLVDFEDCIMQPFLIVTLHMHGKRHV